MSSPRLLAGITVLDASRVFAGPHATMLLADLGAEVWKLEPPDGDETRGWGPPFWGDPADRRSAYFAAVNRNKRSIVVNLKTDAGREVLDRLADRADLLMHNYLPSVAERLGLGARPVAGATSGAGGLGGGRLSREPDRWPSDRPMTSWPRPGAARWRSPASRAGDRSRSGWGCSTCWPGLEAAVAALAALTARRTLGGTPAAQTSVSLVEAATAGLTNILGYHLATGKEPRRWGTGHPDIVPYQVFATRNGHVVVAVGNDGQFARLCTLLGIAPIPEWETNSGRITHRDEVLAALEPLVGGGIGRSWWRP